MSGISRMSPSKSPRRLPAISTIFGEIIDANQLSIWCVQAKPLKHVTCAAGRKITRIWAVLS